MSKLIKHEELTASLELSECVDGFWLYDTTRGMNLSMRAKTRDDAFIETIEYYQNRLEEVESDYRLLRVKVDNFVEQFTENNED